MYSVCGVLLKADGEGDLMCLGGPTVWSFTAVLTPASSGTALAPAPVVKTDPFPASGSGALVSLVSRQKIPLFGSH